MGSYSDRQMAFDQLSPAVILGGGGAVGTLFAEKLRNSGIEVTLLDKKLPEPGTRQSFKVIQADVLSDRMFLENLVRNSRLVVICLPEHTAIKILCDIRKWMHSGSLWVDTLSIKERICDQILQQKSAAEFLSINPLFGPSLGFSGQGVAVVQVASGPTSHIFLSMLKSWGADVQITTANEHDLYAASVQAATHAALLGLGMALLRVNYDVATAWRVSTPPHRAVIALLNRIVTGSNETYWDIQVGNRHADAIRSHLENSFADLARICRDRESSEFAQIKDDIKNMLANKAETTNQLANDILTSSTPEK